MDKMIRTKIGTVVSDKMDKTIVIVVQSMKENPLYGKKYKVSKRFKVHDENNQYKVGDMVEFTSSRPISSGKKYKVIKRKEK